MPAGYILADEIMSGVIRNNQLWLSRRVESGSNANGEYTRWEDGRIEQSHRETISSTVTSTTGAIFASGTQASRDFPLEMTAVQHSNINLNSSEASSYNWISTSGGGILNLTSWPDFQIMDSLSLSPAVDFDVTFKVEGKWY